MGSIPDVAVGATIALVGVLFAQIASMIQSKLDRSHRKDILLREKYEELADYLNHSISWARECSTAPSFAELNAHAQPMAARKAYTLCLLYFPLLKLHAELYVDACVSFQAVLFETFMPHQHLDAGAQAAKNIGIKFQAAVENLRAVREAFDAQIQKHARTYIKA